MKKLITLTLPTPALSTTAQTFQIQEREEGSVWKYKLNKEGKRYIAKCALMFVAGFADGTAEALRYRYPEFKRVFPRANDQYWKPGESWHNKWKNGDPAQGERFFLSSSALVWTTDGYHLARMVRNVSIVAGITIHLCDKKKWYWYLLDAMVFYAANRAGFYMSYETLFKKR